MRTRLFSAFLSLLFVLPAGAKSLIGQAYEAGLLDLETALLYQVRSIRDPGSLPLEYRETPDRPFCGTPLLVQAHQAGQHLGPDYRRRLAKLLARPRTRHELVTPSGHFRIHYDLSGRGAVDSTDADGNQVPDYVDEVARTLDRIWRLEVDSLAFRPPPSDGGLGGGPEYDVYIVDLSQSRAYGYTYPEQGGNTTYSYLELDNNYTDPIYSQTRGVDALHVTVAHEFNHAIQFGYYQGSDGIWWQEATSTWMEEVAYPEIDDYLQYVSSLLFHPEQSLDSGSRFVSDFHVYGAALFAHFLDQKYDRALIRQIWEELGRRAEARLEHFDYVIRRRVRGGLAEAFGEFAVWNYFTGPRYRPGYYREGDKYPPVRLRDIHIDTSAPKVSVERTDEVDHLGATYLHLTPQLRSGGVVLNFLSERGSWNLRLILTALDGSVEIRPVDSSPISLPGWDQYKDIVLILAETDQTGFAYGYSLSVEYDSDLIDVRPPLAFSFGQNYPNPFRPEVDLRTAFPFDLDQPATFRLSIFSRDGRLVWKYELSSETRADSYVVYWDGRNLEGEPVGSGIYYCLLESEGRKAARKMALVRGK